MTARDQPNGRPPEREPEREPEGESVEPRPADAPPDDPGSRLEAILAEQGLSSPPSETEPEPEPEPRDAVEDLIARTQDAAAGGAGRRAGEGGQPGDGGDAEADRLPDAPLFALLRTVEHEVGPERIDRIWVFPPRRIEAGETSVVVVAAFPEIQDDRRRVYAAHYTAPADVKEPRLALNEYGTAPTERVGRLVEDVVERIKDQPSAPPHAYRIDGDERRWRETLHVLAERHLEEVAKNPRLGR